MYICVYIVNQLHFNKKIKKLKKNNIYQESIHQIPSSVQVFTHLIQEKCLLRSRVFTPTRPLL